MILGMSTFTFIHTALSVIGLVAGLIVTFGLLASKELGGWAALYLVTAIATSATGFGFAGEFQASHVVGLISLVLLGLAVLARYVLHYAGTWRWIYAVSIVLSFYFLVFVAIVQAFKKIPALSAMAPTQSEPPFTYAQVVTLVLFIVLAIAAAVKFRPTVNT